MQEEEKMEEGSVKHQWELHLLEKYKEWAHSEGLRMTGDWCGSHMLQAGSELYLLCTAHPGGQTSMPQNVFNSSK